MSRIIPYNKLMYGETNVTLAYESGSPINKVYYGEDLALVRFSEYPRLSLGEDSLTFAATASPQTVIVTTNANWSADTSASWISLSVSGNELTVSVADYDVDVNRTATVTITAFNPDASVSSAISITQKRPIYVTFVEYIRTDQKCWWDTGVVPDFDTKVEIEVKPYATSWNWQGFIGSQNSDDDNTTFQIRWYQTNRFSARVGNGVNANMGPVITSGQKYIVSLDKNNLTIDGTNYSVGASSMLTNNYSMYISGIHNPYWTPSSTIGDTHNYRASSAAYYSVKIWQNDVLIKEYKPALDTNDVPCFYETLSQTFSYNLGEGTPVAGDPIE